MTDTADVIVIGAGVQGASLAFHLAARGARVVTVERAVAGAGATGRSSGLVRMYYDLLAEAKLAWESFQWFRDWDERVGGECGFTKTGFLWIEPLDLADRVRANSAAHRAIGVDSSFLGADEIRDRAPAIVVGDEVAAWEPESGYADPSMTATSFLAAARDRGARLLIGAEVTAIPVENGRVTGIRTSRGDISAPVVVDAAGAWAAGVAALAGVDIPVEVWRHDTGYLGLPAAVARPIPGRDRQLAGHVLPARGRGPAPGRARGRQRDGRLARPRDRDREPGLPRYGRRAAGPAGAGPRRRDLPDGARRAGRPVTGPARDPRRRGARRLLPRLRPQRHRLQDRPRRGPRDGRADPRWVRDHGRHRPFDPGRFAAGRPLVGEHGEALIWR